MIRIEAVVARYPRLEVLRIVDWVARGWVHAEGQPPALVFEEIDIVRLLLLQDLQVDLAVEEESLPLVLSLLDQLYGLRRTLRTVIGALDEAPDDLRQRVIAAVRAEGRPPPGK